MANTCPWGVGSKTQTNIIFETAYGVVPTDTTKTITLPINTNGVKSSQNTTQPATIRGNRSPVEPILGNNDVSGDVVVPVDYNAIGYWLKALLGAPTTSEVTAGSKYKHVYKIGDSVPSFTMEMAFPGISQWIQNHGCKVSKMSLSFGGDGELTFTASVMGSKQEIKDAAMATAPTEIALYRANNFQASVKIGDAIKGKITSFSIEIDNGLDGDSFCIGGEGYREALCEGLATVSGTMEAFFADDSYISLAENSTETSAEIILALGADKELSFAMPEIKFNRTSPEISGPGGIKQSLEYAAYYQNSTEGSAIVVTLTNATESYE